MDEQKLANTAAEINEMVKKAVEIPVLRLKLYLNTLKKCSDNEGKLIAEELKFTAVYGPKGSPNEQWCQWTPAADLSFTISNPAALDKVLPGQFFFVDLIPTTKDAI